MANIRLRRGDKVRSKHEDRTEVIWDIDINGVVWILNKQKMACMLGTETHLHFDWDVVPSI